jgi:hypothetical protein
MSPQFPADFITSGNSAGNFSFFNLKIIIWKSDKI